MGFSCFPCESLLDVAVSWISVPQYVFMGADSRDNDSFFRQQISGPVIHGDAEGPVIGSGELLVPQTWMRRVFDQPFQLPPEFKAHFLWQLVEAFEDRFGNDDISRQGASWPL